MSEVQDKYPRIKIYEKDRDFIIFFTSPDQGVVINSDFPLFPIGHTSQIWDVTQFVDYEGEITLSNVD